MKNKHLLLVVSGIGVIAGFSYRGYVMKTEPENKQKLSVANLITGASAGMFYVSLVATIDNKFMEKALNFGK